MSAERGRSLRAQFPKRHEIPALLAVGAVLLPLGLTLPTVALSAMAGISGATYSVITGALNLAKGGNVLLALLIFTFSLMFPILKLGRLSAVWFHGMEPDRRERALHALRILGKWSMLDVFVAVSLVGAIQFGFLATATQRIGIYVFSTGVLACMIATILESRLAFSSEKIDRAQGAHRPAALPIAALTLILLAAGLVLPLTEMKKWLFWSRDFSIVGAVAGMVREGQYVLGGMVILFVIVSLLCKLLGQILLLFLRRSGPKHPPSSVSSKRSTSG